MSESWRTSAPCYSTKLSVSKCHSSGREARSHLSINPSTSHGKTNCLGWMWHIHSIGDILWSGELVTSINNLSLTQKSKFGTFFLTFQKNPFYWFSNHWNIMLREDRKLFLKGTVFYLRMLALKPVAINWKLVLCSALRGLDFCF